MSTPAENPPISPESPPIKKKYRTYSDQEKARTMALYDMCGSLTEVERKTGIPDSTVSQWIRAQAHANNKNLPKLRNEAGLSLADNFEEIAYEVTSVALRKLRSKGADNIPFGQLMQGGTHAVQNFQLIRGLPTSITEERIEGRAVLVLMQNALGIEDVSAQEVIDVTPEPAQIEGE